MRNTLYEGFRLADGTLEVWADGARLCPQASQAIRNHSPDGFEWGYGGSGPAQLALAILLHATGDAETAERLYQTFKWAYVARFDLNGWRLLRSDVLDWATANLPKVPV